MRARGSILDSLSKLVRHLQPVDFYAHYECKVLDQHVDGTLELEPTDERLLRLGEGLSKVKMMVSASQGKVKVQPGKHVLICFANGDPVRPRVLWWEEGTIINEEELQATKMKIGPDATLVELTGGTDAMLLGETYRKFQEIFMEEVAKLFLAVTNPIDCAVAVKKAGESFQRFEASVKATVLSKKAKVG